MEETIKQALCIGLMTGTSVDGIDAAILDFSVQPYKTVATHSHSIPDELKKELHSLCIPGDNEIDRMGQADAWLGEVLAEAANTLIEKAAGIDRSQILAIGCHGQTIRHRPSYKHPFTL
jgi:anhydro-N-acetylmuramic acid kinase